jgi:di/tricarboxylate transporter
MPLLILGIVLTAVCWYFAWSHIGLVSEYSFFPLWVGYILLVNGLSEVMAETSLLRRMHWSSLWLFIVSIPMWWFFEYMNSIVPELALPVCSSDQHSSLRNSSID